MTPPSGRRPVFKVTVVQRQLDIRASAAAGLLVGKLDTAERLHREPQARLLGIAFNLHSS